MLARCCSLCHAVDSTRVGCCAGTKRPALKAPLQSTDLALLHEAVSVAHGKSVLAALTAPPEPGPVKSLAQKACLPQGEACCIQTNALQDAFISRTAGERQADSPAQPSRPAWVQQSSQPGLTCPDTLRHAQHAEPRSQDWAAAASPPPARGGQACSSSTSCGVDTTARLWQQLRMLAHGPQ